ncbi:MAG: hypothetical protein K6F85_06375 [Bacteroidales bacterium]|nr:hypothetical protein [Bacteroidales bacterium]
MKKHFITLLLVALCLAATAQEEQEPPSWIDVSWVNFVATGGTDENNALLQYMLFSEETMKAHEELFDNLTTLQEEIMQVYLNKTLPSYLQEMEEGLKQAREQLKNNPEMLAQLDEAMREFEKEKTVALREHTDGRTSYSFDPAAMLLQLKPLAINHKVYTGWSEAGNGLYAVIEVPRYASLKENAHYSATNITIDEKDYYRWSLIDGNGRQIVPPQYGPFNTNILYGNCYPAYGLMCPYRQEADGSVNTGAIDYRGQVRIPFTYDKHIGMGDEGPVMKRYDGKLDYFNKLFQVIRTEE